MLALLVSNQMDLMWYVRLKKVQGKKKRDTAARNAAESLTEGTTTEQEAEVTTDLLRSKDEDIIF